MQADSFDEMVSNCVLSGFKHRLLYVFVRIGTLDAETRAEILGPDTPDEDAGFVQVQFDAHQPAAHGLTFDQVRDTADAHNPDWDILIMGIAKNSDATLPTEEQAQAFLANMRERILAGDIEDFAVLDRTGRPIAVETGVIAADDVGPIH